MRQTITLSIEPNTCIPIIKKIRSNVDNVCHERVENSCQNNFFSIPLANNIIEQC